jgi:hypothetical protein
MVNSAAGNKCRRKPCLKTRPHHRHKNIRFSQPPDFISSKSMKAALEFVYTMLWAFNGWCSDGQSFAQTQIFLAL